MSFKVFVKVVDVMFKWCSYTGSKFHRLATVVGKDESQSKCLQSSLEKLTAWSVMTYLQRSKSWDSIARPWVPISFPFILVVYLIPFWSHLVGSKSVSAHPTQTRCQSLLQKLSLRRAVKRNMVVWSSLEWVSPFFTMCFRRNAIAFRTIGIG